MRDVIGERLVVGKELFQDAKGGWKVLKRERERYLPLLAHALAEPDEVWARVEWMHALGRAVVRRRYLARYVIEGQEGNTPGLAVFELGADGWSGVTAFPPASSDYLEHARIGVRLYRREE